MANSDIRAPQVRVKGKKVADANDYEMAHDPKDELQVGADGVLGATVGANQTDITLKGVLPVRGLSVDFVQFSIDHTRVDVEYASGGKAYRLKNAMVGKATLAGKSENGEATYDIMFSGGSPEVVG